MTVSGHTLAIHAFGASHQGRVRSANEDRFLLGGSVFAVADGMGGHQAGEIASEAALGPVAEIGRTAFDEAEQIGEALAQAVRQANTLVVERAQGDPSLEGMGTTLTAIAIRNGLLHVAHVGDSRAYLLREDEQMSQLTTDHTLVERLVREGRLSRDEAAKHPQRNVITRAIGHEPTVDVESLPPITLQDGDQILLCSDGLTGPVSDDAIAQIISDERDGQAAVDALVAQANASGGPDNITVILIRVGERWARQPGPSDTWADKAPPTTGTSEIKTVDTRVPASSEHWATTMGRIGAEQGADRAAVEGSAVMRRARVAAGVLGVLIVLGLLVGGGYFLLSRAYFVSAHDGDLAIYRGLPQQVAGLPLSWVIEDEITDTPVAAFPAFRQQEIEDGYTAQTLGEARRIVADLQNQLREAQQREAGEPDTTPFEASQGQ